MLPWLNQIVAAFHLHQRQQTESNQHVDLDRNNAYATIFGTYFFPQRLYFRTSLLILVSWSPGLRTNIKSSEKLSLVETLFSIFDLWDIDLFPET